MNTYLPIFAILALSSSAKGNVWNDSDIFVEAVYRQSDASGSFVDSVTPVAFRASARDTFSSQTQSLTLPASSLFSPNPMSSFQKVGAHHVFWYGGTSLPALNEQFGQGMYSWNITGNDSGGTFGPSIDSVSFSSINFQPQIVNGSWRNGRLLVSASNPQFQIANWMGASAGAKIEFELWRDGGAGGSTMSPNITNVSWSPQPVGAVFSAYLSFRAIDKAAQVNSPTGLAYNSRFGRASTLYFQVEMVGSVEQTSELPTLKISPGIVLSWKSSLAQRYQVLTSLDLLSWYQLGPQFQGTGGEIRFHDPVFTDRKFYKLQVLTGATADLEILEALYGAQNTYRDVRTYIKASISGGQVDMRVGNSTLGGDPIFGFPKTLYVRYRSSLGEFEATILEGETLRIPVPTLATLSQKMTANKSLQGPIP